jgi:hypothetical protein
MTPAARRQGAGARHRYSYVVSATYFPTSLEWEM